MLKFLFLSFCVIFSAEAIVCPENYCANITCENPVCDSNQVLSSGFCDCCQICVNILRILIKDITLCLYYIFQYYR